MKLAVTVRFEEMVSASGLLELEAPPVQVVNENPLLAVAVSCTEEPVEYWPDGQPPLLT